MSADVFVTLPVSGPFVAVPADVAKDIAAHFRKVNAGPNSRNEKWADLLDPQPPSLREQAVAAFRKAALDRGWNLEDDGEDGEIADAVLAVVADWLAAQPLHPYGDVRAGAVRAHDVRLVGGQS